MGMMYELIIGFGQIGKAVKQSICPDAEIFDINGINTFASIDPDVLHICFPYSDTFVEDVKKYIESYKPKHVVIYSTVPIGTCRQISPRVVHSPIEGVHPHLAESIKNSKRWVGFNSGNEGKFFVDYFTKCGLSTHLVASTETTELVKLRSTAKYGVNLVWAQYETELCKKFGVSYEQLMAFDQDYNATYINNPDINRYILYPPNGEIGGHCIVPNAKLLNEQFPSELLDKIIEMGPDEKD
jgi:UDP-glucose 6-dehydrogenase